MSNTDFLNVQQSTSEEAQWISLSDLMTSLMLVFMLLAISFMVKIEMDNKKIKDIAFIYNQNKLRLYEDLNKEFSKDLKKWGATLGTDLTVRFNEPEVLFEVGQDGIKPKFQTILNNFFPRYITILTDKKYKKNIQEVRIEGHTSTIWNNETSPQEAYFYNMELSQSRTRSTLKYVMSLEKLNNQIKWLKQHVTANGLSSSRPIFKTNGQEDLQSSQRVEFRVITNSEEKLSEILMVQK